MTLAKLIEHLQAALQDELGAEATVYLSIDNNLYEIQAQTYAKGSLGPGFVLLTKGTTAFKDVSNVAASDVHTLLEGYWP